MSTPLDTHYNIIYADVYNNRKEESREVSGDYSYRLYRSCPVDEERWTDRERTAPPFYNEDQVKNIEEAQKRIVRAAQRKIDAYREGVVEYLTGIFTEQEAEEAAPGIFVKIGLFLAVAKLRLMNELDILREAWMKLERRRCELIDERGRREYPWEE